MPGFVGQRRPDARRPRLCRASLWRQIRPIRRANSQRGWRVCEAFDEKHWSCSSGHGLENDQRLSHFADQPPRQGELSDCQFHLVLRAGASARLAAQPCGQGIFKLGLCLRARNRPSPGLRPAASVGPAKGARESSLPALNRKNYLQHSCNSEGQIHISLLTSVIPFSPALILECDLRADSNRECGLQFWRKSLVRIQCSVQPQKRLCSLLSRGCRGWPRTVATFPFDTGDRFRDSLFHCLARSGLLRLVLRRRSINPGYGTDASGRMVLVFAASRVFPVADCAASFQFRLKLSPSGQTKSSLLLTVRIPSRKHNNLRTPHDELIALIGDRCCA